MPCSLWWCAGQSWKDEQGVGWPHYYRCHLLLHRLVRREGSLLTSLYALLHVTETHSDNVLSKMELISLPSTRGRPSEVVVVTPSSESSGSQAPSVLLLSYSQSVILVPVVKTAHHRGRIPAEKWRRTPPTPLPCVRAAVSKYHRPTGLTKEIYVLTVLEAGGNQGVSGIGACCHLPPWLLEGCLLPVSSHGFPLLPVCGPIPPSYKNGS